MFNPLEKYFRKDICYSRVNDNKVLTLTELGFDFHKLGNYNMYYDNLVKSVLNYNTMLECNKSFDITNIKDDLIFLYNLHRPNDMKIDDALYLCEDIGVELCKIYNKQKNNEEYEVDCLLELLNKFIDGSVDISIFPLHIIYYGCCLGESYFINGMKN